MNASRRVLSAFERESERRRSPLRNPSVESVRARQAENTNGLNPTPLYHALNMDCSREPSRGGTGRRQYRLPGHG